MTRHARTFAIAGPKGGIGKTTSAITLAKAFVAKGRRVLVVDTASMESDAALMFELKEVSPQIISTSTPVHTPIDNISFIWCKSPSLDDSILNRFDDFDDIIFDLSYGFDDASIRIFNKVDFPLLLASPEPVAISLASQWIRRAFAASAQDKIRDVFRSLPQNWVFSDIEQNLSASQIRAFCDAAAQFKCGFVLNHRREQNEVYQSQALCHAWGVLLGLDIRFFGSISADDRRWFFARNLADVSLLMREDPIVRDWDAILRSQFNDRAFEDLECLPLLQIETQAKKYLRVQTAEEARSAYRVLWEGYRRENGFVAHILSRDMITQTIAQLELAYRRSDDDPAPGNSNFPGTKSSVVNPAVMPSKPQISSGNKSSAVNSAVSSHREPSDSQFPANRTTSGFTSASYSFAIPASAAAPADHSHPGVKITSENRSLSTSSISIPKIYNASCPSDAGSWLEKTRINEGLSAHQLALKTRIAPKLIDKLEKCDIHDIPPARLQAYLLEIARVLNISPAIIRAKFGL